MPRVIAVVLVTWAALATAIAAPTRVVLADPDPELHLALERALAPWKIVVVVVPGVPTDAADARARAVEAQAQFVIWRTPDDLVVYDPERDLRDERPSQAGRLDPIEAAAAALTVKTLLRLPRLELDTRAQDPDGQKPPADDLSFGVELGTGVRAAHGSQTEVSARARIALWIRPVRSPPLRLAVEAEVGTTTAVNHASFKGTASDWSVRIAGGWTVPIGPCELEPGLAVGARRSTLVGTEMMSTPRDERATRAVVGASVTGRRRFGRWLTAAVVSVDAIFGTPTYTRTTGPTIYQAPSFSVVGALAVGIDVGR